MKLTKNFRLKEFTKSAGIVIEPTDEQIFCMQCLCENILQPIRSKWGRTTITSGLRNSRSTNLLIANGYPASKTSDHLAWCDVNPRGTGAADINVPGKDMKVIFDWCINNFKDLYRQLIYYPDKNIIHVSNTFNMIFTMPDDIEEYNKRLIYVGGKFISY